MAMAALRHATRRLACQPRRLLHRGSYAVGRNFSLAEERRWMFPRLIHGGSPAAGRTYSRQFSSFHHGEPNPITLMEKAKEVYKCYDLTMDLFQRISFILFKLALAGAIVADCCGSQYLLLIFRTMVGLEPPEKWVCGKEGQCHACGQALGEGMRQQQQKMK